MAFDPEAAKKALKTPGIPAAAKKALRKALGKDKKSSSEKKQDAGWSIGGGGARERAKKRFEGETEVSGGYSRGGKTYSGTETEREQVEKKQEARREAGGIALETAEDVAMPSPRDPSTKIYGAAQRFNEDTFPQKLLEGVAVATGEAERPFKGVAEALGAEKQDTGVTLENIRRLEPGMSRGRFRALQVAGTSSGILSSFGLGGVLGRGAGAATKIGTRGVGALPRVGAALEGAGAKVADIAIQHPRLIKGVEGVTIGGIEGMHVKKRVEEGRGAGEIAAEEAQRLAGLAGFSKGFKTGLKSGEAATEKAARSQTGLKAKRAVSKPFAAEGEAPGGVVAMEEATATSRVTTPVEEVGPDVERVVKDFQPRKPGRSGQTTLDLGRIVETRTRPVAPEGAVDDVIREELSRRLPRGDMLGEGTIPKQTTLDPEYGEFWGRRAETFRPEAPAPKRGTKIRDIESGPGKQFKLPGAESKDYTLRSGVAPRMKQRYYRPIEPVEPVKPRTPKVPDGDGSLPRFTPPVLDIDVGGTTRTRTETRAGEREIAQQRPKSDQILDQIPRQIPKHTPKTEPDTDTRTGPKERETSITIPRLRPPTTTPTTETPPTDTTTPRIRTPTDITIPPIAPPVLPPLFSSGADGGKKRRKPRRFPWEKDWENPVEKVEQVVKDLL